MLHSLHVPTSRVHDERAWPLLCSVHTAAKLPRSLLYVQVYAYALGPGRDLGSFEAHDDAVTCLVQPDACLDTLLTGSWDSTVRSWR